MYLYNSGLTGPIPPEIGQMVNLTYLNLGNNQLIGEIPSEIGNLVALTSLRIYNNELNGEIPFEIGNLVNLTTLSMHHNQLSGEFPESIGNLESVSYFNLSDNQLSGLIPDGICHLNIGNGSNFIIENNQFCPPYPECLTEGDVGEQDISMCNNAPVAVDDGPFTVEVGGTLTVTPPGVLENDTDVDGDILMAAMGTAGVQFGALAFHPDGSFEYVHDGSETTEDSFTYYANDGTVNSELQATVTITVTSVNNLQITELIPSQPAPGQMITLRGMNFGSPINMNVVNFTQGDITQEGFLFLSPSNKEELFVRIPSSLAIGTCSATFSVSGDNVMTSDPFSFTLDSIPGAPVIDNIFIKSGSDWVKVDSITAKDTVLVSGYGIDTSGGKVLFSKGGEILNGIYISTYSNSELKIAPAVVVPSGLGTGEVDIMVSVTIGGEESEASNPLKLYLEESLSTRIGAEIPTKFALGQNYPNPFNPTTTISFSIPEFGLTNITVYDLTGRELETLTNEVLSVGNYFINWNASNYPSGVYLIKMDSGDFTQTQKVVLVK